MCVSVNAGSLNSLKGTENAEVNVLRNGGPGNFLSFFENTSRVFILLMRFEVVLSALWFEDINKTE